jgi:imidazolonepropionase-like amidohydrolase
MTSRLKPAQAGTASALLAIVVLALGSLHTPQAQVPPSSASSGEVIVRGGWLWNGVSDARVRNTGIVIRNGKILEVGADLAGQTSPGARVVTLDDSATIVPGFFDLHAHYNMNIVSEGRVEEADTQAMIHLANGVTSTWSAGEFLPEVMLAARDRIESGKQPGTRIFPSGPYFGAFRCEYKIQKAEDDCIAWPNNLTEKQIRDDLDYWASRGVRSIKIKQSTPEEMRILIDQAHKRGMTTTSHLGNYAGGWDVHTKEAILMGLDRVEHWLTEQPRRGGSVGTPGDPDNANQKAMIDLFLKHRVFFDANMQMFGGETLWKLPELRSKMLWVDEAKFFTPYARTKFEEFAAQRQQNGESGRTLEQRGYARYQNDLKALYEAGGGHLITLGTDLPLGAWSGPVLPGFAYHREMQAMVYSGLPPLAVLKAATMNGARALKVSDQLGSIEPGKIADLVIVSGNPLQDITAAREVRTVIKAGQVYDPKALLDASVNKIGPTSASDHEPWKLFDKIKPFGVYR